jgi:diguanylate cyclase (GGDEF)-like protein
VAFLASLINTSRLSASLLTRILLFSGLFTIIITSLQLYLDYKGEIKQLEYKQESITKTQLIPLGTALGDFNELQVQQQLEAIIGIEGITFSEIITGFGKRYTAGNDSTENVISKSFDIIWNTNNIGELKVYADKNLVKNKIIDKFYVVLISQAIKTFLVAIFILYILHRLVISHITEIAYWLNNFKAESSFSPISLEDNTEKNNEMIKLKSAISEMGEQVYQHTAALESKVAQRTKELEQAKRELEKLAFTDNLTGIANRNAFFKQADEELSRSRRLSYDIGIMMLDLDHFKSVNDNYGHDAGDEVLKVVSKTMNDCLRKQDTLGRIGGEEFAIIVPGTDKVGMHRLATRLQASIELQHFSLLGDDEKITVSIGYTKVKDEELFKSALKRADLHLYTAKNNGRNQFITDKEFVPSIVS